MDDHKTRCMELCKGGSPCERDATHMLQNPEGETWFICAPLASNIYSGDRQFKLEPITDMADQAFAYGQRCHLGRTEAE